MKLLNTERESLSATYEDVGQAYNSRQQKGLA